jgi:hypothetical protein
MHLGAQLVQLFSEKILYEIGIMSLRRRSNAASAPKASLIDLRAGGTCSRSSKRSESSVVEFEM